MSRYLTDRLPDLIAAVATIGLGIFAYSEARSYELGELRAMEAGYFPTMISIGMIGLGLLQGILALVGVPHRFGGEKVSPVSIVVIAASLLTFAFMIERFGIIPALFCTVFMSTFASEKRNYPQALMLSAGTAVISAVVFVYLLGLSIKVISL